MKKIYTLLLFCFFISIRPSSAQFGNALNFDGVNDYVSAGLPSVFNNIATQNLTVEAWIKPESFVFSRILFAQANVNNYASLAIDGQGHVFFYIVAGSQFYTGATTTTILLNQWTHIAVTWNASSTLIEMYINGAAAPSWFGGISNPGTDNAMSIGARTNATQFFNGAIDELRIWDTERTSAQINAGRNGTLSLPQAGLVAYYKFNQGIGNGNNPTTTTLDDALNAYNGSLHSFALNGTVSNWITNSLVLPLQWLDVRVSFNKTDGARLSWNVKEKSVISYIAERSADGKNFNPIATVTGSGDGVHAYNVIDRLPIEGINYYRIKQIDQDGMATYSKTMTLTLADGVFSGIHIYPNPATTSLNVLSGGAAEYFRVYDGAGRLVYATATTSGKALHIDIAAWQPGIYFYNSGEGKGSFIKQ